VSKCSNIYLKGLRKPGRPGQEDYASRPSFEPVTCRIKQLLYIYLPYILYGYCCIGPLGDAYVSQFPPDNRLCALYTLSEPMSLLHFRPAEPPERKQALP